MQPEITVVMATYKQANYLEEAIESLRRQSATPMIWAEAMDSDKPTLAILYEQHDRGSDLGFGILEGKGNLWRQRQLPLMRDVRTPYLSFFDSDDVMLPGWLDKGLKVAEEIKSRGKIPIVGPSYRMVDENLKPIQDVILPEFSMDRMMEGCIIPDFSITTTEALRSVGGYFDPDGYELIHPMQSYGMWLRILKLYGDKVEVKLLPDIGFLYRQHPKAMHQRFSLTKKKSQENVERQREVARHYFPLGDGTVLSGTNK